MWSRVLSRTGASTVSQLSTFESSIFGSKGLTGPWILTVPQLETNTASSELLPWRSQIPMTVRYKIPDKPPPASTALPHMHQSITGMAGGLRGARPLNLMTPNGLATWNNITTPAQEKDEVRDPTINKETYKFFQKGTHRHRVVNNRPKPQVTQRIRRTHRKFQRKWDKKTKERELAIVHQRKTSYMTEKKRVQSSDWWDWYIPYDNPPMQF